MASSLGRVFVFGMFLTVFTGFAEAAGEPPVRDNAGYFTPGTVQKANGEILALQKQYKVELAVQTVAGVPSDKAKAVAAMKPTERDQYFSEWALQQAKAAGIRGIFVLICKVPGHLQVEVGKQTQKEAFTLADRNKLSDVLLAGFSAKDHDKALRDGIALVRDTLQKNVPPTQCAVVPYAVKDYGGFFSAAAIEKANLDLQALPHEAGKEVAIETFATPPPAGLQDTEKMSSAERNKYFNSWAEERASESKFDGVLVLICKRPAHALVKVHGTAAGKLLAIAEIKRMNDVLLPHLRNHENDQGLSDLVRMLRAKLAPGASVAMTPPPPVKAPDVVPPAANKPAEASVAMNPAPPVKPSEAVPPTAVKPAPASSDAMPLVAPAKTPDSQTTIAVTPAASAKTAPVNSMPEKSSLGTESASHTTGAASVAKDALATAKDKAKEAGDKAKEIGQTRFPTWMWAAGIVGGLFVLWILSKILRAVFGGGQGNPPAQRPMPTGNTGSPMPTQGANYNRPPQGSPPAPQGFPAGQQGYPAQPGYPRPPQSYPAAQPGYAGPQQGYPAAQGGYPPPPQGGGGGGIVGSVIGGAVGGVAGSMAYEALRHAGQASAPGGVGAAPVPRNQPYQPSAPGQTGGANVSGSDGYVAGGDFDASPAAGGGDFDGSVASTGGGGDFDTSNVADAGGGGDFDSSAPTQESMAGGGDFDSPDSQSVADDNTGGDFGNQPAAQFDDPSGGSFDAPSDYDQASSGDAGGGDFGGGGDIASDASNSGDSGGDFG